MKEERARVVLSTRRGVVIVTVGKVRTRGEWQAMKKSSEVGKGWPCLGRVAGEAAASGNSQGLGGGLAVSLEVMMDRPVRGTAQGVWGRLQRASQDNKTRERDEGLGAFTSCVPACGSLALSFPSSFCAEKWVCCLKAPPNGKSFFPFVFSRHFSLLFLSITPQQPTSARF